MSPAESYRPFIGRVSADQYASDTHILAETYTV